MSKKAIVYLIFFGVLFAVFYGVMMYTTDFAKVKLPVLNTVQHFSFLKQDSTMVSEQQTQGKVYVAEYFFTSFRGICPKMNKNIKAIYERFKSDSNFLVISHTVNPETDSLPVMRHYADSMGANSKNWWFVTGSKEALYKAARESYMLDDPKNNSKNIDEQFLHTQFFTLVDRIGRVRGVYDGIKKDEIEQLIHDITELIAE